MKERNSSNYIVAQLVRDGNIGGILSRTTADGPAFYGYDGNGNVTLLTNSAGQDVGHYRYDAFGQTLEATGPRVAENPYRFSTKELHGPSGLYDYGLRFYSPGMGRWLNRDPLEEDGGVNLYGFVGNNPVNNVDDYGLDPAHEYPCGIDSIPGHSTKIPDSCGPKPAPKPAPKSPPEPPASGSPKKGDKSALKPVAPFFGTITQSKGKVELINSSGRVTRATVGTRLYYGDLVRTGRRSGADIKFKDQSRIRLGQLSSVEIRRPRKDGKPQSFFQRILGEIIDPGKTGYGGATNIKD